MAAAADKAEGAGGEEAMEVDMRPLGPLLQAGLKSVVDHEPAAALKTAAAASLKRLGAL